MRASDLREQITIQSDSGDSDLAGGIENVSWSDVRVTRAHIEPVDGTMSFDESQTRGNRTYIITIRYPKDYTFNRSNRIVWGSITLVPDVTVNFDNLKHWLTFEASTETP